MRDNTVFRPTFHRPNFVNIIDVGSRVVHKEDTDRKTIGVVIDIESRTKVTVQWTHYEKPCTVEKIKLRRIG